MTHRISTSFQPWTINKTRQQNEEIDDEKWGEPGRKNMAMTTISRSKQVKWSYDEK